MHHWALIAEQVKDHSWAKDRKVFNIWGILQMVLKMLCIY